MQNQAVVHIVDDDEAVRQALSLLMRSEEFVRVLESAAQRHGRDNPSFYAVLGREQRWGGEQHEAGRSSPRMERRFGVLQATD